LPLPSPGVVLVGLGNPGPEHSHQRHNVGFQVLQTLATRAGVCWRREPLAWTAVLESPARRALLLRPRTLMNRSGRAVGAACEAAGLTPEDVLVVHDELDLPLGTIRLKRGGGHGGHNGLRSVLERIGPGFARLRVGIGHPGPGADVSSYVLSPFTLQEQALAATAITRAGEAVLLVLEEGLQAVMNEVNRRRTEKKTET